MSLQWTMAACFLYLEIACILLFLLPIISAPTWQRFFKSKFFQSIAIQANLYFYSFLIVLIVLFVDSIREMKRYTISKEIDINHNHIDAELQHSMKLFRSQRNFYIAGMSLFLYLVIHRLIKLIMAHATIIADQKASLSQAASATRALRQFIEDKEKENEKAKKEDDCTLSDEEKDNIKNERQDELAKLRLELASAKEECVKSKIEFESMKRQAKSSNDEYSRLLKEHEKLLQLYDKVTNNVSNKKDD